MAVVLAVISAVGDGSLAPVAAEQTEQDTVVYFPLINRHDPWPSPFGIETRRPLEGVLVEREEKLGSDWLRRHMVSWREIQPNEGDPYDWTVLASFENELRAIRRAGTTPIVIVHHSPRWATVTFPVPPYNFAQTDCSAIRADKFDAFAAFMQALVQRYSQPEFNVHYWELGNEPDVDPRLVDQDQVFGCWGEIEDPFYGGEHYGEMLKVVTPAIKAVDPQAKVLIGGLLLDSPDTPYPYLGKPELFLKGILEAGAAPFFDILPYHAYPAYTGVDVDQDNAQGFQWDAWGGWTLGKARYLRDLMAPYGVDKPLWINEIALGCNPGWYTCDPPTPQFFEAQASFVARTLTRDLSEDIRVFTWYSLDGPGWRNTGLLNWAQDPRQAYIAYQHLGHRLSGSEFEEIVADYGPEVEAYSFVAAAKRIHVVWSIDTTPNEILVPKSEFRAAYDRDGAILEPTPVGDDYSLSAGFAPIYIELKR
jgi:hypothetical protein